MHTWDIHAYICTYVYIHYCASIYAKIKLRNRNGARKRFTQKSENGDKYGDEGSKGRTLADEVMLMNKPITCQGRNPECLSV